MKQRFFFVCVVALLSLSSSMAMSMDSTSYMDGLHQCGQMELEGEELNACYEDRWHIAVSDCATTGSVEDCWLNYNKPYDIDSATGQAMLPDLYEVAPPEDEEDIQGMTWWQFTIGAAYCSQPIVYMLIQPDCMNDLIEDAQNQCENWGGEHCWW